MKTKLQTLRDLLYETDTKKQTVFSDQPAPLTNEDKRAFMESLKTFSQLGESVYGNRNLEEITERLSKMVETASRMVTEKEDIVDSVSASRHMKHVSAALNEFKKSKIFALLALLIISFIVVLILECFIETYSTSLCVVGVRSIS